MLQINGIVGGTYQVIQEIGHGGTGVIYLAYHLNLQKYIVLKRITAQITSMDALRREADILKNLRHTNIPQIYDFLIEDGEVFTVMDYIEGVPLNKYIIGANQYSEEQLIRWMSTLTDVLVYLQSRHPAVIHSDIKPENIIITPQNTPVLIDFNISLDQNSGGKAVGYSRSYASPEQAWMAREIMEGRPPSYSLDGRTDIYSLGAVFYSLVSGLRPDSNCLMPKLETMQGLIYSQPFLSVIDKCMEWDRDKRFRNAGRLASAISDLYKMDRTYRRYTAMRAASWLLSAVIFAAGCFCLIHGVRINDREKAERLMTAVAEETASGDFIQAGKDAKEILSHRGLYGQLDKSSVADLYRVAGDAAYTDERYAEASEYYKKAADITEKTDPDALAGYYSDLAVAYLKSGDMDALDSLVTACRESGLENGDIRLVEAAALQETGDYAQCLIETASILDEDNEASVKAKACVIAAQCFGTDEPDKKLKYMRQAVEYSDDIRYARECASLEYANAGRIGVSDNERRNCAERAVVLYEKLCRTASPQVTDLINLGISYYYSGHYDEAISTLTKAAASSDSYRIAMYQALAAEKTGDADLARDYCSRAMLACKDQKSEGWEEDYEILKALSNRL